MNGVDRFLEWMSGLPPLAVYPILALLAAVENVFPPVPADVAVVLGAFLAKEGVTSAPLIGFICWLANTASSAGMYFLARRKGRAFFESGLPRKLMPPSAMKALEEAYARRGVLGIFLSRFLPGVRAAVTPFAGVVGMSPARALVPAAGASLIWYAVLVVVGAALGLTWDSARNVVEDATRVLAWIAGAVTVVIIVWLVRRARA
ncbi:MAG TPA: DedA family protein [Vicinamibacteria bacterium]|nr:DedA family protein [Vicinamibacteria bacterium]